MHRFFVTTKVGNKFALEPDVVRHMRVRRIGQEPFICIYQQTFYVCKLVQKWAHIQQILSEDHELSVKVTIAMALIEPKRFAWMIQKATELGATEIIPLITKRVVNLPSSFEHKQKRWQTIAKNAAAQSYRNLVPIVARPISLTALVQQQRSEAKYIAHETSPHRFAEVATNQDALYLIGPEGGFTDEEIALANQQGFADVCFGPRILRAETAPLYILAHYQ